MSSITKGPVENKRRAYQCLRCLHKKDIIFVNAKNRVEGHILTQHLGLDDVPYYCKLCLFRCFKYRELQEHVLSFPRHNLMLQEKGIENAYEMLVSNKHPHLITDKDMVALSQEQSAVRWAYKCTKKADVLAEAVPSIFPEGMTLSPCTTTTIQSPAVLPPVMLPPQVMQRLQHLLGGVLPWPVCGNATDQLQTAPNQYSPTAAVQQNIWAGPKTTDTTIENQVSLDYEVDIMAQILPDAATPTLDEKQEDRTKSLASSTSSSLSRASASERDRKWKAVEDAMYKNIAALKRQEAALTELARAVRDLSQQMVMTRPSTTNEGTQTDTKTIKESRPEDQRSDKYKSGYRRRENNQPWGRNDDRSGDRRLKPYNRNKNFRR